jgi:gluconolactonase
VSDFEIIAEGLLFPEGPIIMPDGSVIFVEMQRRTLSRAWGGEVEVISELGGGPNGAALGPDGAVYVCNNGGSDFVTIEGFNVPTHASADYTTGRIERVDLGTGRFERLYDSTLDHPLSSPNDLVFDAQGGLWFTDLGKGYQRHRQRSGLFYCRHDGSLIREAAARCVCTQPGHVYFDSLAVQSNGDICVATLLNGGITVITPQGVSRHVPFPDMMVTNICFGGEDMQDAYLTLSGKGMLVKTRWPDKGLRLNFVPYPAAKPRT